MAFKLIFLLHCIGLLQWSSSGEANGFSSCNYTKIEKFKNHLEECIDKTLNMTTSGSHPEKERVIDCCPKTEKREALLACIYNFTKACVAPRYPNVWSDTDSFFKASCGGSIDPQMDNVWNGTVTYKDTSKCKIQRRTTIGNKECGNHTLVELKWMWISYKNRYKPV